ncbi:unnamed protein product, partial [marine sediment metagenome]
MRQATISAIFFLMALLVCVATARADTYMVVNAPVANMYYNPDDSSPLVSQAIYASPVKVVKKDGGYSLVKTNDNYKGWIKSSLLKPKSVKRTSHVAEITNLFAKIYQEKDTTQHKPLIMVPFSTRLQVLKIEQKRWIKVRLVDGRVGWLHKGDVTVDPRPLNMKQMLLLSRKFLGMPYQWAGVSTFGFDCSGYVQMLFREMG